MLTRVTLALGNVTTNKEKDSSTLVVTVPSSQDIKPEHRLSLQKGSLELVEILLLSSEVSLVYNNPLELANWVPFLQPSAIVKITVSADSKSSKEKTAASLKTIHTSLLLAGLKATSEEHSSSNDVILHVQRKERTSTQSRPLKLNINTVNVQLDDDLIDEDDLLGESNDDAFLKPPSMDASTKKNNAGDDCGGRLPCDNCTCGRADGKVVPAEELSKEELMQKSSACGNCPKGDAFRCASCPFLGKPAFKAGEEHLVLNLVDDF